MLCPEAHSYDIFQPIFEDEISKSKFQPYCLQHFTFWSAAGGALRPGQWFLGPKIISSTYFSDFNNNENFHVFFFDLSFEK